MIPRVEMEGVVSRDEATRDNGWRTDVHGYEDALL